MSFFKRLKKNLKRAVKAPSRELKEAIGKKAKPAATAMAKGAGEAANKIVKVGTPGLRMEEARKRGDIFAYSSEHMKQRNLRNEVDWGPEVSTEVPDDVEIRKEARRRASRRRRGRQATMLSSLGPQSGGL